MATPKTSQLANLANQFPAMAERGKQVQQSSAALAAAEAVRKQAATGQRVSGAEMGAQLYTAQAAAAREAQQKVQQRAAQVGQLQLQEDAMKKQQALASRQLALQQQARKNEKTLSELSTEVKTKLYDKAMQFQKDELERTRWQTSQLMDYAVRKNRRWQDLRQVEQKVGQMQQRRMTVLKTAQARIKQSIEQEFSKTEAIANRDLQDRLMKAEAEINRRIKQARADAAEEGAMWEAIGTGLGAVAAVGIAMIPGVGPALAAAAAPVLISGGGALGRAAAPGGQEAKGSREEIRNMIRRR